jgi:chorismate mutase
MKRKQMPQAIKRLEKLRVLIDKIDSQIVKLLNKRVRTAQKVGRLKKQLGYLIRAKQREKEVIARVLKHNRGTFNDRRLLSIYRIIIAECRDVQKKEVSGK